MLCSSLRTLPDGYGWLTKPLSNDLEAGFKYIYTLDFTSGSSALGEAVKFSMDTKVESWKYPESVPVEFWCHGPVSCTTTRNFLPIIASRVHILPDMAFWGDMTRNFWLEIATRDFFPSLSSPIYHWLNFFSCVNGNQKCISVVGPSEPLWSLLALQVSAAVLIIPEINEPASVYLLSGLSGIWFQPSSSPHTHGR